jgi:hypothetical protein
MVSALLALQGIQPIPELLNNMSVLHFHRGNFEKSVECLLLGLRAIEEDQSDGKTVALCTSSFRFFSKAKKVFRVDIGDHDFQPGTYLRGCREVRGGGGSLQEDSERAPQLCGLYTLLITVASSARPRAPASGYLRLGIMARDKGKLFGAFEWFKDSYAINSENLLFSF